MAFTDTFIKRPVLAICFNLLLLLAGYAAFKNLNVRQYPKSDVAVATITTPYIGADATLVQGFVTTPLERAIASADGIDYLESSSNQGLSTITAHLRLNFDPNDALTQIQSKIAEVRNDLPPEAEAPIVKIESNDSRFASMYLSFYSDKLAQNQITDYLTRVVQPRLSSLEGVQRADILGARTFAMRIWLKPDKMAARAITPLMVSQALENNNYLSAVGQTNGSSIRVDLTASTNLHSVEEFKELIVKREGNNLVRLEDVSDVTLGAETYDEEVRFGGKPATFMGIWTLPNANSLDVIERVREIMPDIKSSLPEGMQANIPYDSTEYINDALNEVFSTLIETVIIVVIVIFLFLGSIRSVIVPVVAIPLSLLSAGILLYLLGFTVNLLTLLAIVLAVGLVVDDAIVMLENIERHVREGKPPKEAALIGARELVYPVIVMTLTLVAVYTPLGLQGGLTGTLFREFAFTLAGAVFMSGVVALTLSPVMAAYLVRSEHSRFQHRVNATLDKVNSVYISLLRKSLNYSETIIVLAVLAVVCIVPFYMFSMKELAPREDQGVVFGIVQASPDSTIDQTSKFASEIQKVFRSVPEHANTFQLTQPTFGFSGVVTKPWSQRSRTTQEIEQELWGKMSVVPGVRVILTTPPPLPGGSDFPVEFVIASTSDPRQINDFANQIVGAAFASGVFMFADSDLKYDQPKANLVVNKDKAALMGFTLRDIGLDLGVLLGGNYVNRFDTEGRSYKVIPRIQRQDRLTAEQISQYYVGGTTNKLVPFATLGSVDYGVKPRTLNRFQQLNSAKIQGAQVPGVSVDAALQVLEAKAKEILPSGYKLDYAGESRQLRSEGGALAELLLVSIVIIFLVLAAQFESFRDPFVVLFGSVPLALSGSLLFCFLGFTSLNVYSQVGLITLVGLVAKNGVLLVEFANTLIEQGKTKTESIIEAASTRLRPILMTSVATVVGHFPLVIATGAGSGSRNSIGIVLVTGMTIGTILTLFVVPSIYLFIASGKDSHE
jgi:multidrug efflux pump